VRGSIMPPDWVPAIAWREEANAILAQIYAGTSCRATA
jgi:hypothetical protein